MSKTPGKNLKSWKGPKKNHFPIGIVLGRISRFVRNWDDTTLTQVSHSGQPFRLLIGCLLSLRTKDETTHSASERLFSLADTPEDMIRLPAEKIEKAIYPVGFFRTKTKNILAICRILLENHGGKVPSGMEALLSLPGVGRKTANLVLGLGFGVHAICVDTHVHRITNRWGLINTRNPLETEMTLRKDLPKKYWIPINDWLVQFGQKLCKPISPLCSRCPVRTYCARKGVRTSR